MRRGLWVDVDLADLPDRQVMLHPGWTNDREGLSLAIREVGWYPTTMLSFLAAEEAELKWGWVGTTEDNELVLCNDEGIPIGDGTNVNEIAQVTLALVTTPG